MIVTLYDNHNIKETLIDYQWNATSRQRPTTHQSTNLGSDRGLQIINICFESKHHLLTAFSPYSDPRDQHGQQPLNTTLYTFHCTLHFTTLHYLLCPLFQFMLLLLTLLLLLLIVIYAATYLFVSIFTLSCIVAAMWLLRNQA